MSHPPCYTTRMKIEFEITVKEIETGLYVASYQGKEISHGRTIYQAVKRAEEFLKKDWQSLEILYTLSHENNQSHIHQRRHHHNVNQRHKGGNLQLLFLQHFLP